MNHAVDERSKMENKDSLDKLRMEKFSDELRRNAYSGDASGLSGEAAEVFTPLDEKELQSIVATNSSITIRGGGSGLMGGAVPSLSPSSSDSSENSVIIDLSKMDKILDIDPARRTAVVEAGVILQELNDELEKYSLEFPIIPLSGSICTIGGMIATNASGPRSAKYKRMSDCVLELEIVDGRGKIQKISRIDSSNFIGMEGITGIIYKAKLKLISRSKRSLTIYRSGDIFKIIEVARKLKLRPNISIIYMLDSSLSQILGLEKLHHLIVEFESDEGEFKGKDYLSRLKLIEYLPWLVSDAGYTKSEDPKLFLDKIPELSSYLSLDNIPYHANLGIGIIHPLFKENEDDKITALRIFIKKIRGQVAGTYGIGRLKKEFLDMNDKKLVERIKKRYDPYNKLNKGVIIDAEGKTDNEIKRDISREITGEISAEISRVSNMSRKADITSDYADESINANEISKIDNDNLDNEIIASEVNDKANVISNGGSINKLDIVSEANHKLSDNNSTDIKSIINRVGRIMDQSAGDGRIISDNSDDDEVKANSILKKADNLDDNISNNKISAESSINVNNKYTSMINNVKKPNESIEFAKDNIDVDYRDNSINDDAKISKNNIPKDNNSIITEKFEKLIKEIEEIDKDKKDNASENNGSESEQNEK